MRPLTVLSLAVGAGAPAHAAPPRTSITKRDRIELTAVARDAAGRVDLRRKVRLAELERPDVRVVRRSSASVTVTTAGARGRGARATLTLAIAAGNADPLAFVRREIPGDRSVEGTVDVPSTQSDPAYLASAFRLMSSSTTSQLRFKQQGVAASRLTDTYGHPLGAGLLVLRMAGQTAKGTNTFPGVPGLASALRAFGAA